MMRGYQLGIIFALNIALFSCNAREFNPNSQVDSKESSKIAVSSKAFNAFEIWNGSDAAEILEYPKNYLEKSGSAQPDGLFYLEEKDFWNLNQFLGIPTLGAKVEDEVLMYPERNGKTLKLKFAPTSKKKMSHFAAVEYCRENALRLPTAREILDFCGAGVKAADYGPDFKGNYPRDARCAGLTLWTASVTPDDFNSAWQFAGGRLYGGFLDTELRVNSYSVRCVAE